MHHAARWVSAPRRDACGSLALPGWQVALCTIGFGAATILTILFN